MPWIVKLDKERGLHRPLGARARRRAPGRDRAGRLHDGRRARPDRGRRRAVRQRRPDGPGHVLAALAPARQGDRDGVGAGRAGRRRRDDHDLRRGQRGTRRPSRPRRSTTPRGRCCARELRVPVGRPRRERSRARRWSARRARAGARFELRDGWNVAVVLRGRGGGARAAVGFADCSHLRKYELQGELPGARARPRDASTASATWLPHDARRARSCSAASRRPARSTSRPRSPRCASPGRWRARRSRASRAIDLRPQVTRRRRLAAGLGRAHAGRDPVRGRGPLPDAVRRRARPVRLDGRRRTPRAISAAARSAHDALVREEAAGA